MADQNLDKKKRCYIQARNFYYAAKRCGRVEICEESGYHQALPIPEYVNLAFSCELYFKALLYQSDEKIEEHKLLKLYNKLNIEIKHKVSEILKMNEVEIRTLLKDHSCLFTDMRYRFESSRYGESFSLPLVFFYSLAETLDQVARETIQVVPCPSTNIDITLLEELPIMSIKQSSEK